MKLMWTAASTDGFIGACGRVAIMEWFATLLSDYDLPRFYFRGTV